MKAFVIERNGGPEVLALRTDFPDPVPGEGEVVLRVGASSLNYHDIFTRRGMPGIRLTFPVVPASTSRARWRRSAPASRGGAQATGCSWTR